jgi:hypothetical protein
MTEIDPYETRREAARAVRSRDFRGGQAAVLIWKAYVEHAVADGMTAGEYRRTARRCIHIDPPALSPRGAWHPSPLLGYCLGCQGDGPETGSQKTPRPLGQSLWFRQWNFKGTRRV